MLRSYARLEMLTVQEAQPRATSRAKLVVEERDDARHRWRRCGRSRLEIEPAAYDSLEVPPLRRELQGMISLNHSDNSRYTRQGIHAQSC
jgi:hypothetical protein